jgi:hypothetical protein
MGDDVEVIAVAWLNSILGTGWAAHGKKPKDTPEQYVLVDRAGGPRVAMVLDAAQLLIEVYHKNDRTKAKDKAYEIADKVPQLNAYSQNVTVRHDAVNSVVHLPDLQTGYERYQVYIDIKHRR